MFTNIWIFHHQGIINMVTMAMVTLKNLFKLTKDELHSIKTHKIFFFTVGPP